MNRYDEYQYTKRQVIAVLTIAACSMVGVIAIISGAVWLFCRLYFG